ncbi:MarR family winged helix-turn-helix transcriptional regulator [Sinomonas terrae]|uniref:MarR family transcriptional regulator n=1 Tax=Sinomonas terrae TaxID=2908838 RepID=A0ABS9U2F0_9MICC|nr:MarR family transcriptional regulator [Sinomonas terrae]MCH6470577.1 MarR family transcriptional regulator [Sinomonas terrae]
MTGGPARGDAETTALAAELRTAVNRLAFYLRRDAGKRDLTPSRLAALAALERGGPQRPGDLAASLGISAASMSRLTEALEGGGWVRRTPDAADKRAFLLALTEEGTATINDVRREGTSRLAEEVALLSPKERAALVAALPVLTGLADRHLDGLARSPLTAEARAGT